MSTSSSSSSKVSKRTDVFPQKLPTCFDLHDPRTTKGLGEIVTCLLTENQEQRMLPFEERKLKVIEYCGMLGPMFPISSEQRS